MKSPDLAEQRVRSLSALGRMVEWITPWVVEVGSWALGGLIALNLVVISALITVGPVDRAVRIGLASFACALPFDVAGIILLRLIKDARDIRIDDLAQRAFQEAQFPDFEAYLIPASERESFAKRRVRIALAYALVIAALSIALTLAGLVASLWHMAPWVAGVFVVTVAFIGFTLVAVVAQSLPPESEAERELRRRYSERRRQEESR
jgi:hypothetical protein